MWQSRWSSHYKYTYPVKCEVLFGFFILSVCNTVKIARRLRNYEEKYVAVEMEVSLRIYIPCEVQRVIWSLWAAG